MGFEWREIWGYLIGGSGMIYDKLPHTCEGLTNLFALFIVIVTFFFITIPHAFEIYDRRKKEKRNEKVNSD